MAWKRWYGLGDKRQGKEYYNKQHIYSLLNKHYTFTLSHYYSPILTIYIYIFTNPLPFY